MSHTDGTFEHWACIYDSDQQFLDTAAPFLADGLALGEPVFAVTTPANLELLNAALGARSGDVDYADSAFFGRRPPQRVAAFYRYWKTHTNARDNGSGRVRILAEPVWAGRSARQIAAWIRMEAVLNVALAPTSISMICPYDARTLGPDIISSALRTHPVQVTGTQPSPSPDYTDPATFVRSWEDTEPLPDPPATAAAFEFDGDLRGLRRFIADGAAAHGVTGDLADMLALAVSEVGAYLKSHGPRPAVRTAVRAWEQPGALVCDFRQPGLQISDPFLGLRPAELAPGDGDGLWLANQICDSMEIRSGPEGCTIQLQVPSQHDQEMAAQPGIRYPAT